MQKSEAKQTLETFTCKGRADGFYADVSADCRQFHSCTGENGLTMACPQGTLFDQSRTACVLEDQHVICGTELQQVIEDHNAAQRTVLEMKSGFDCTGRKTGYYADPQDSDCRRFHFCYLGTKRTRSCPRGSTFLEDEVRCARGEMARCGKSRQIPLVSGNKRQIKFKRLAQTAERLTRQIKMDKL